MYLCTDEYAIIKTCKQQMKKIFSILIALLCCISIYAKDSGVPQYELKCAGIGVEGTFLIEVSVFMSKPNDNTEMNIRRAAVHGVLFKGVSASDQCSGYRPIVSDKSVESSHHSYFSTFFSNTGQAINYAEIIPGSLKIIKLASKQYSISAVVTVKKDDLRKILEDEKIIEKMGDLF